MQLLQLADQYAKTKPAKQKAFLSKTLADAKGKEKHIFSGGSSYSHHISRIADTDFVASIKAYYDKTDGWFGFIEELRMNLAKHEVPKKRGMVTEMPGYARMGLVTGTLYWQFIDAHGGLQKLDRREAANFFLDIQVPDYDDDRDELLARVTVAHIFRRDRHLYRNWTAAQHLHDRSADCP